MKGFWLAADELTALREAHKAERNRHAAYKINTVILLGTGWQLKQVKEALLLDDETLRSYVGKYRKGGVKELISTNYRGSQLHLNEKQIEQLRKELERHIYLTTRTVIEYVQNAFSVIYTPSGMRDLLHHLGYEYKKPKLVPGAPDIDAQEIFVEHYEAFMLEKPADTEVLFVDAVHPEHNALAAVND